MYLKRVLHSRDFVLKRKAFFFGDKANKFSANGFISKHEKTHFQIVKLDLLLSSSPLCNILWIWSHLPGTIMKTLSRLQVSNCLASKDTAHPWHLQWNSSDVENLRMKSFIQWRKSANCLSLVINSYRSPNLHKFHYTDVDENCWLNRGYLSYIQVVIRNVIYVILNVLPGLLLWHYRYHRELMRHNISFEW